MKKDVFFNLKNNRFFKDNLYMFIGNFMLYFLTYVYQFYLGHTFSPDKYSLIGTLFAILSIISLLLYAVQVSIAEFVSKLHSRDNSKYLFKKISLKSLKFGAIFGIIFLALSPLLAKFLHIDSYLLFLLIAISIIILLLLMAGRGLLQGLQNFKALSFNYGFEGGLRLLLGIAYVMAGYKINGVMGALLSSYLIAFILIYFSFRKDKPKKEIEFDISKAYSKLPSTFITLTILNIMWIVDLLLARHFLSATASGYYAAISLLGKIIPSLCITIGVVLIPKVANASLLKQSKLLKKSLLLTMLISSPIALLYFIMPKFIINIVLGQEYLAISQYIGWFGIAMIIYALIYIITYFNIGRDKKRPTYIIGAFLIIEIVMIWLFHADITQIIQIILATMSLLFISLFLPIWWKSRRQKEKQIG